jgi:2-polyprenyl-6-methoxyphenol hydroxylase-like FAD-dependent oxidoreductase
MQQTAIVIGSGMGGLATAQVLSKHFERVVIIERDDPRKLLQHTSLEAACMEGQARPGVQQVGRGSDSAERAAVALLLLHAQTLHDAQ